MPTPWVPVVLANTRGMSRAEWCQQRHRGIGGSDAPVLCLDGGVYGKTPQDLWAEKRGMPSTTDETPAMRRGQALEDIVARLYQADTGYQVRRVNCILGHPVHPWMIANVDREIRGASEFPGPGILEIKCPGMRGFLRCKREGLPDHYQIQLQHYLAVTGRRWGAFAIFSAEFWELLHFPVQRDDELIALIGAKESAFWRHVENGVPPPPAEGHGGVLIPAIPIEQGDALHMEGDGWRSATENWMEAVSLVAEAERLRDDAASRIQNLMEASGASVAEGAGVRVSWKPQPGRVVFDHKGFAAAHPDLDLSPWTKRGKDSRPFRVVPLKQDDGGEAWT